MRRALPLLVVLAAAPALADMPWLTARGRLLEPVRFEVFGGPRSLGAGVVVPDQVGARAALGAELAWNLVDRTAELRGSRQWQLTDTAFGTAALVVGVTGTVVPEGGVDLGLGPNVGLVLNLGGQVFNVDLGLATGVDLFVRQEQPRFPQRLLLAFNLHVSRFTLMLAGRLGVDLVPGHPFVGRGEFVVAIGWAALGAPARRLW